MLKTLIIEWCINSKTKTWDTIEEWFDKKYVRWNSKFITKYKWYNNIIKHTQTHTHKHNNEVGTNSGVNSKYEFVDIALKE